MEQIELTKERLKDWGFDAVIRIKDHSGFFDAERRRLWLMYSVASNCEAYVVYGGLEPCIILSLQDKRTQRRKEKEHLSPFPKEVKRIGSLLKRFSLLIDPEANIEIDYPDVEELIGRCFYKFKEFWDECQVTDVEADLSNYLAPSLEERIDAFLDSVFLPENWMMGVCHSVWRLKKDILRYGFNIDWKTPAELNPHIIYD